MAKRGADNDADNSYTNVTITNGKIKGYHAFRLKCVPGMEVDIREEEGGKDEKALMCFIPRNLPPKYADVVMTNNSSKKSYVMKDIEGKAVGRVQYFLNGVFKDLLEEGKVAEVKGVVTGLPTTTKAPPASQKWVKNKQAGGGAYIPCKWVLLVQHNFVDEAVATITNGLTNVEEGGEMEVQVDGGTKKKKM